MNIGHNTRGKARISGNYELVVVDFVDQVGNFLFVHSLLKPAAKYRIYRTEFTPMTKPIPPRYREYVFHSMAHVWAQALNDFPKLVEIDPAPLALETYAKKLRESRDAKNDYGWTHPLVDEVRWQQYAERLKIGMDLEKGVVILGTSEAIKNKEVSAKGTVKGTPEIAFCWNAFSQLEQLCFAIPHMEPRQIFVVRDLTPDQIESLEARYDVGIIKHSNGIYHIV